MTHFHADPLLVDTVDRVLSDVSTQDEIERAEESGWSQATWNVLAEAGLPWVGLDETTGGSGGTVDDLAAILSAVGRHAASVPVAETALLGGWLLTEAGLALPDGPVTVAEPCDGHFSDDMVAGDTLTLRGTVAWARHAERIVTAISVEGDDVAQVVSLRPDQVTIVPGANLAGEARDTVVVDAPRAEWETAATSDGRSIDELRSGLRNRGSLSRSIMAAGALSEMSQMTIDYAYQRHQFGKPVATFQAVQTHLVTAAQSAVKAQMAADVAVRAFAAGRGDHEIAAARVIVDGAITVGTRAAHQAHGAMGVTREYPLHQLTRRLWSWRHDWGTTTQWRRRLGSIVVDRGAEHVFDLITERPGTSI